MHKFVDPLKLQKFVDEQPKAKAVFQGLAKGKRPRKVTDLQRLRYTIMKTGTQIERKEFASIFKELERLGLGSIVIGRGIEVDKFHWDYNYIEWSKKVLGRPSNISEELEAERNAPARGLSAAVPNGWMSVSYPIRDEVLQLSLPTNLTKKEAEELASFIKRFGR